MTKMYFNVICVLIAGFFFSGSTCYTKVPNFFQNHHQSKVVVLKDKQSGEYGDNNKAFIVLDKPEDKKFDFEPHFDDGYKKSWKTLRSEKYEAETIDNPHSDNPANRFIVKSSYKVREKLPFGDTTVGYDHEYEYPSSEVDHDDYQKNSRIVDYNNAQNDPFHHDLEEIKPVKLVQVLPKPLKKPKLTYYYQSPTHDFDYYRNVHVVDSYLSKNKGDVTLPLEDEPKSKKYDEYGYVPPSEKYTSSGYEYPGPSKEPTYQNYKTDGPSFDYLGKVDYS